MGATRIDLPFGRSRWLAAACLAVMLGLMAYGLALSLRPAPPIAGPGHGDVPLYARIVERVQAGEDYYRVATDEQRAHHYPLRPFLAVRPPALAVGLAALPSEPARRWAVDLLALATLGAWAWRLRAMGLGRWRYLAALGLLGCGMLTAVAPQAYAMHEVWAGLLVALSLALWRPAAWVPSVAVGLAAALVRELAAPYLLAMLALALKDRRWREAAGWLAALAVWGLGLWAHAAQVDALLRSSDLASPGWLGLNGWPFVLEAASWSGLVAAAGTWGAALLLPPALLGLALWRDPLGERLALTVGGYVAGFLVVGRVENAYWGLLIATLWPLGLVFAPQAIRRLAARAP